MDVFKSIRQAAEVVSAVGKVADLANRFLPSKKGTSELPQEQNRQITRESLAYWQDSTPQEAACWELLAACLGPAGDSPDIELVTSLPLSSSEAVVLLGAIEENFDFFIGNPSSLKRFLWQEAVKQRAEEHWRPWNGDIPIMGGAIRMNEMLQGRTEYDSIARDLFMKFDSGIVIDLSVEELEACGDALSAAPWCLLSGAVLRAMPPAEEKSKKSKVEIATESFSVAIKTMLDRCSSIGELAKKMSTIFEALDDDPDLQSDFVPSFIKNKRRELARR